MIARKNAARIVSQTTDDYATDDCVKRSPDEIFWRRNLARQNLAEDDEPATESDHLVRTVFLLVRAARNRGASGFSA
jgi:hypothetical protein